MFSSLKMSILLLAGMGIAQASIIHEYTFNTPGQVTDLAGTANGTLEGSASVADGKLVLDGNGYVQFATHLVPTGAASYSVSLQFQLATTDNPGIMEFISQGYSGGPGFYLGTNGFGFRATDLWGPSANFDPALEHTLLFSVDGALHKSYFYLDGVLVDPNGPAIATTADGTDTRFGSQFDPYSEHVRGTLDNIRIFNTAITPGEDTGVSAQTPEPSTILTGAFGLAAAIFVRRRRQPRS